MEASGRTCTRYRARMAGKAVYVCYGERVSGVIRSQAIDVVRSLESMGFPARLAALVPWRGSSAARGEFLDSLPDAVVAPALPLRLQGPLRGVEATRLAWMLRALRPGSVICRNAIAADLTLRARRILGATFKVCLDGRGAVAAEQEEFRVNPARSVREMAAIERRAVLGADARIAVTPELLGYWRSRYGYEGDRHVVIPTTLSREITACMVDEDRRSAMRARLGITGDEVVLAYSGSTAAWQGMDLVLRLIRSGLQHDGRFRFLLLTDKTPELGELEQAHPNRVMCRRVKPDEVRMWLEAADYGIMLRGPSVTNSVAFPTKYAEYIAAGLRVICNGPPAIAEHVRRMDTGLIVEGDPDWDSVAPTDARQRARAHGIAATDFSKDAHASSYRLLMQMLAADPVLTPGGRAGVHGSSPRHE